MKKKQTNEELIEEAEWADTHIPDNAVPPLAPDGFEKIAKYVEKEREKNRERQF